MRDPVQAFRDAINATLGHAPDDIEPGPFVRFGRGKSAYSKLFDDLRGGVFGCHRQGVHETWHADAAVNLSGPQRAALARQVLAATIERQTHQRQQWADNAQRIAVTWARCVPLVAGDPVTRYLERRGLEDVQLLSDVLRFHRALTYWEGDQKFETFPAMVARIVAPDGRTVALHRTYLTPDGHKADVPSPKKVTSAAGPLGGACIPLFRPANGCIGIAEGIETALAASCASALPTVAAYCAGNLAAWQWPAGVQRVVIFADADRAGREAADALRLRVLAAHLRCEVMTPTDPGADWADVWAARSAVEVSA